MNLLQCMCGCDRLSRDELEVLINSTNRVNDFLNNTQAVAMFQTMFESRSSSAGGLKYLKFITMAKHFKGDPSPLADEDGSSPRSFTGMIDEALSDRLLACTDDSGRIAVLEEIINEYSSRLKTCQEYKAFQQKLKKAYQGKEPIRQSD